MSAYDQDAAWELSLARFEDARAEDFKWAWAEAEGELVWRVSGPGDGGPTHEEQLRQAWGRGWSSASGDILGMARYAEPDGAEPAVVSIHVYYGEAVPPGVVRWFRKAFPGARLHHGEVEL